MKHLILIWSIFYMSLAQAVPPVAVNGEQQSNVYVQNIKVPNNQATKKAGLDTRIETGNTNLLSNPSFEHSTFNTGWTTSLGTASLTTNALNAGSVLEGLQAYKITSSGAGVRVAQVSTINAAALKGQQLVARVKIYSTDSAIQACALVDNISTGDTNCITVPVTTTDLPFRSIEIPFIGGGTSNGIVIKSATTTSQTIYIDDAFVGTMTPFQSISGAKLVGTAVVTGCASVWSTSSTTFASLSTQTGCVYTTSGQAQAPSTNLPAFKFASLPAGDYKIEYSGIINQSTSAKDASFQFSDGTNTARETESIGSGTAGTLDAANLSQSISYSTTQSNVTLEIKAKTTSGGSANIYGTTAFPGTFKLWYFPPDSRLYSQQAYYPSITAQLANFTVGAGNYLMPLDTISSNDGSYSLASNGVTIKRSGTYKITLKADYFGNGEGVTQKIDVNGVKTSGQAHAIDTNGSGSYSMFRDTFYKQLNVNDVVKFYAVEANTRAGKAAEMVIDLVDPNPTINGSFSGIEKCANDFECAEEFTAKISSTGVVSNENLDWINGNCSVVTTSNYRCTYNTNLKDGVNPLTSNLNCSILGIDTSVEYLELTANTDNTKIEFKLYNSAGSGVASDFRVKCSKGASDYKPKTGKIASSTDVVTSPSGSLQTKPVSFGAMVSAAGVLSLKTGADMFTTCSTSSNVQTCTLNRTLSQKATCQCVIAEAPTAANLMCNYDVVNSTTSVVKIWTIANGVASARDASLHCDGIIP